MESLRISCGGVRLRLVGTSATIWLTEPAPDYVNERSAVGNAGVMGKDMSHGHFSTIKPNVTSFEG
jgi:hypothetical protein